LNINQTIEDYARKLMVGLEGPLDSFIANFNSGIAEQNESMILVALEMLGEWSLTIISMLEHFDLTESDLYVDMSQSESITRCFFKILSLSLPEPSLSDPCFFSIANTKSHRSLNTTKTKTLAAINMILTNLLHNKAERLKAEKSTAQTIGIELTESPLTRLLEKVVPTFAVSLVAVCSMRDVPVCDRDTVDDLVTECLSTMGKMAREGRFSHHFANLTLAGTDWYRLKTLVCKKLSAAHPKLVKLRKFKRSTSAIESTRVQDPDLIRFPSMRFATAHASISCMLCCGQAPHRTLQIVQGR
jgi:hypothetical protein